DVRATMKAVFKERQLKCMTLAEGALRGGLGYVILHLSVDQDIRSRTLRNIQLRFLVDTEQPQRVSHLAEKFIAQTANDWQLDDLSR
ncbi:guanosine-5'-triphosphate,3'-diphosphate pyrophosphatase, partial [Escherichia coli]|nr:guanosine-5'-triphosphate,3'-diphosphate pyrophosphatase [Escherichia coli]